MHHAAPAGKPTGTRHFSRVAPGFARRLSGYAVFGEEYHVRRRQPAPVASFLSNVAASQCLSSYPN